MEINVTKPVYKFDYRYYTRSITGYKEYTIQVELITEWRRGYALCQDKEHTTYLLNKDSQVLYYNGSVKTEDGTEIPSIQRIFGGFYVAYDIQRCNYRTFPGQDRDTEYDEIFVAKDVISEDGKKLEGEELYGFLSSHDIFDSYSELGEGVVLRKNELYKLNDYSLIKEIESGFLPYGKFADNIIRVYNENHHKCFYVLVNDKKIVKSFEKETFDNIVKITNPSFFAREKKVYPQRFFPSESINVKPEIETKIIDYLYGFPDKYNCVSTNIPKGPYLYWELYQAAAYSGYFSEDGVWYNLNIEDMKRSIDELRSKYYPIKNFVTNIYLAKKEIEYDSMLCDLYVFECQPYGFMDRDGIIDYNFDIDHIDW